VPGRIRQAQVYLKLSADPQCARRSKKHGLSVSVRQRRVPFECDQGRRNRVAYEHVLARFSDCSRQHVPDLDAATAIAIANADIGVLGITGPALTQLRLAPGASRRNRVVQQFCFVAMVVALIWGVFGSHAGTSSAVSFTYTRCESPIGIRETAKSIRARWISLHAAGSTSTPSPREPLCRGYICVLNHI
jgi:hypothetical protein